MNTFVCPNPACRSTKIVITGNRIKRLQHGAINIGVYCISCEGLFTLQIANEKHRGISARFWAPERDAAA